MFSASRNRWMLAVAACVVAWVAVTWAILSAIAQIATGPTRVSAAAAPVATTTPAVISLPPSTNGRTAEGLGQAGIFTVAADPNDLPFSNEKGEGFENKIAELVAKDMGVKLEYQWRAQRRGFVRETLKAGTADAMMGVPTSVDMTLPTIPYYRSTYAFVYRSKGPAVRSFDDPRIKQVKVGIELTGDSGTPAAYALAKRGVVDNLVGYTVYADYARANPTARVVEAVASGEVDVAVVWGPLAGYFAPLQKEPLMVAPLQVERDGEVPLAFNMSMGVSRDNKALKARLDEIIVRRRGEIEKILDGYGVPRLTIAAPAGRGEPKGDGARGAAAGALGANGKPCDCE